MNKLLYIIRGLPGSGKTTFAQELAPDSNYCADNYFCRNVFQNGRLTKVYIYNRDEIKAAHSFCRGMIELYMQAGYKRIAVHNVFARNKHIKPYIALAKQYGYDYHVLHMEGNHGNVHNVPENALQQMKDSWEDFSV